MDKEVIAINVFGQPYLLKLEYIDKEKIDKIESLIDEMWDEYYDELDELTDFEIVEWLVEKLYEDNIILTSINVSAEFNVHHPMGEF